MLAPNALSSKTITSADARSDAAPSRAAKLRWGIALAVFALALAPAVAGGVILFQGRRERVVREALVNDLLLRVESADWLHDTMDHGKSGFQMPAAMTPGMPLSGQRRLSVEVSIRNAGRQPREFNIEELELRSSDEGVWPAVSSEVTDVTLGPGEIVSSILQFDVPEKIPGVRLLWTRAGANVGLLNARPEDHPLGAPSARPDKWPEDVEALPQGDASLGERLFATSYGCMSCHGDPRTPGSNMVGPHFGSLGTVAQSRIPGKSAKQYIYDSILYPDAFVAPECARGLACATPSVMPSYGEILPLEEMAALVAYLSQLDRSKQ